MATSKQASTSQKNKNRKTTASRAAAKKTSRISFWQNKWIPAGIFIFLFACLGTYYLLSSGASSPVEQLKMTVVNTATNLCMDDENRSTSERAPIITYGCNSSDPAQQWTFVSVGAVANNVFLIKNPNTNVCVDDTGDGVGNGPKNRVHLITWDCNSSDPAQAWSWTDSQLKNAHNDGCINDPSSTLSDTQLIVYPCGGTGKTYWDELQVSSSGGGSGGGSSTCPSYMSSTPSQAQAEAECMMQESPWDWTANSTNWNNGLLPLWTQESSWKYTALNGSGACGLPQSLPCVKEACNHAPTAEFSDMSTNTTHQIIWGLDYIKCIYGNPYAAEQFELEHHYYIKYNGQTAMLVEETRGQNSSTA